MSYYIWRQKWRNKAANMPYCYPIHSVRPAGWADSLKPGLALQVSPALRHPDPDADVQWHFPPPHLHPPSAPAFVPKRKDLGRVYILGFPAVGDHLSRCPAPTSQRSDPVQHSCRYGRMPLEGRLST